MLRAWSDGGSVRDYGTIGHKSHDPGLQVAYELGRNAVSDPVGLLNLVHVHHEVLLDVLRTARMPEGVQDIGSAAAAFLIDAATSFQMTQRGYLEKIGRAHV